MLFLRSNVAGFDARSSFLALIFVDVCHLFVCVSALHIGKTVCNFLFTDGRISSLLIFAGKAR